jgi:phosphoesterase RecJ-like protein
MFESVLSFIDRHQSIVLTTHDHLDADGLGSELVMASILENAGKEYKIINSSPVPEKLKFIVKGSKVEKYDNEKHKDFLEKSAMMILDTSDLQYLGSIKETLKTVKEIFIFDHHEPNPNSTVSGFIDSTAASTAEIAIELACHLNIELNVNVAAAAYAGIVYDSGFFAYPKTNIRTFKAAIKALEWGAVPNYTYRHLMENSSYTSMLLQKQALLNLEFYAEKKIAVIILRKEDYDVTGAAYDEKENIANIPLATKEVEVSVLIKENPEGNIRCSLRSKGLVNVSIIAQGFNGGGHFNAAGFRSSLDTDEVLEKVLKAVEAHLNL